MVLDLINFSTKSLSLIKLAFDVGLSHVMLKLSGFLKQIVTLLDSLEDIVLFLSELLSRRYLAIMSQDFLSVRVLSLGRSENYQALVINWGC